MLAADNPFAAQWATPHGTPPFSRIKAEHFMPAFLAAMAEEKAEIAAIAANPAPPTFDNTLIPLEKAGEALSRVGAVFGLYSGTLSTPELQDIEVEIEPLLSRHHSELVHNPAIFARIDAVFKARDTLPPEARRLVEEYHRNYVLAGAALPPDKKARLADINAELAMLETDFGQRLLNEVNAKPFVVEDAAALAGLPAPALAAAAEKATSLGKQGGYAFSLMRPEVELFLQTVQRRDLREKIYTAFIRRGDRDDEFDTKGIIPKVMALRQEGAKLRNFSTYAHLATTGNMAKTPEAAMGLLKDLWEPAKARFLAEKAELQAEAAKDGQNDPIQPWDWYFYAEKVRQQKYALDDAELKPYLSLENVRTAAFATAERLFGLRIIPAPQLEVHHPDADAWEVQDTAGQHVGIFYTDFFARDSKRSGAWMSELRGQHSLGTPQRPHIYNVCNFTKPAAGQPALLSLDDAITVFHEFGHGLHGLLSRVTYPSLAGTNVYQDFVELPSQLYEHWLTEPKVMQEHLRHVETGASMPMELCQKIQRAKTFNEGFDKTRYLASALVDIELHLVADPATLDVNKFEAETLAKYGLPEAAVMMHRLPHFKHSIESGYSANYYVYIWAGVLEHDAFDAFTEAGDPYDSATAKRLAEHIYSAGNRADPMESYLAFRGKAPTREALLRNTGLGTAA